MQQLWVRWPLQPLQPLQNTQLQPPFGPSMDSLCHPCITTIHLSYSVLSLKLPPSPCAVLLVHQYIHFFTMARQEGRGRHWRGGAEDGQAPTPKVLPKGNVRLKCGVNHGKPMENHGKPWKTHGVHLKNGLKKRKLVNNWAVDQGEFSDHDLSATINNRKCSVNLRRFSKQKLVFYWPNNKLLLLKIGWSRLFQTKKWLGDDCLSSWALHVPLICARLREYHLPHLPMCLDASDDIP